MPVEQGEAQAWPVEAHGALRSLPTPPTDKKVPLAGRAIFVHVLRQLAQLFRGHAQCFG
jgi:hypothetical protein